MMFLFIIFSNVFITLFPSIFTNSVAAASMDTVITTVYDIFNRKLFSLPKLILIPSIMAREPMLIASTFPFIILADKFQAWVVASLTDEIQRLSVKAKDVSCRYCFNVFS